MNNMDFIECENCGAKPGTPTLCKSCLDSSQEIANELGIPFNGIPPCSENTEHILSVSPLSRNKCMKEHVEKVRDEIQAMLDEKSLDSGCCKPLLEEVLMLIDELLRMFEV